jgi:hypothetical protein
LFVSFVCRSSLFALRASLFAFRFVLLPDSLCRVERWGRRGDIPRRQTRRQEIRDGGQLKRR